MIPRLLEFEDNRVKVTAEAFAIPEIKAILDKHGLNAEPYLSFVGKMAYPDGAYVLMPQNDRLETAIYDVKETLGDFDYEDDLLEPAIDRLRGLWESENSKRADELEEEVRRWMKYLKETPLGGEEMKNRLAIADKVEKLIHTATNIRKLADEEISIKMKGTAEMGEY